MPNIEVGERIKELRQAYHYSREEVAAKVGISAKFLYEIETGKKGFSAVTLCKLAEVFSVSCDYIMFGKEYKSKQKRRTRKKR